MIMRKLFYAAAVLSLAVMMMACKTTEANYKAAYEIAKNKATDTGDSLTTCLLSDASRPKMMVISGDSLPVLTELVAITKDDAPEGIHLHKYCVVSGRFAQIFNARQMRNRMVACGYSDAFLAHNRMNNYFVVVSATDNPSEAREVLDRLKSDTSIVLRPPFPYVLRPAQFVR